MESCPARAVCGVDIEVFGLYEDLHDGKVVEGGGPVQWKAVVGITQGCELGVCREEGFNFRRWRCQYAEMGFRVWVASVLWPSRQAS